MCACN